MIATLRNYVNTQLDASQKEWLIRLARKVFYVLKWPWRVCRGCTADLRMPLAARSWNSFIPMRMQFSLVNGTLRYTYRGIPAGVNPIDMALYLKLLWDLKPLSIIEFGTKYGGTAVWFGDMMQLWQSPAQVVSIDIKGPWSTPWHLPFNVKFIQGDEGNLSPLKDMFAGLPHPWFIIDDASHNAPTTLRGMQFLHQYLRRGDYMIIKDGWLAMVGEDGKDRQGGPTLAISRFLDEHGKEYEIDTKLCDFFGPNVTGNTNGYLRRL